MPNTENCEYCANYKDCGNKHKWNYKNFLSSKTDIDKIKYFLCKKCLNELEVAISLKAGTVGNFIRLKQKVEKALQDMV
jgi:hypothetical protein